jgi:protein-disulfide isomerase
MYEKPSTKKKTTGARKGSSMQSAPAAPDHSAAVWPIREAILGIFIFAAGAVVGYEIHAQPVQAACVAAALDKSALDDPARGPEDAPVTIVEFADYQCPYCQQWFLQVYPLVMANYGDKVRFIFRDFPLSMHQYSEPAAEAANCAGEQGKYWDYQNLLWGSSQTLDPATLRSAAEALGLTMSQWDSCTTSHKYKQEISADLQDGLAQGVNGTPAFVINGKLLPGGVSYEQIAAIIEKALAQ